MITFANLGTRGEDLSDDIREEEGEAKEKGVQEEEEESLGN